ncbi:hypothetical protein FSP39_017012 [Pinctada imbricata]|uniref:B box-type domain-containing protein n=1 Tax=Pinctada imbricata TaxID=66713 RepID=A0AA88YC15_PINIB|nr:hypothetical protein FSP39_017012 [Pinctada imbricata]
METEESAQVVSTCDDCGEDNDVKEYCLDCHGKLCKKCKEIHLKKKLTSHHRVLSLTDPQSVRDRQSASVPCVYHPGKVYSTFCKKCQIACCSDCMMLSHSKHEFLGMEEVAESARDQTIKYRDILFGYHDNDISCCIDKIEDRISDVATKRKRYRDEIKEKADSLRKTLDEFEGKLNNEVDQMLNSEENGLKKTLAKVKDNKETISFVMNTCEQRLNHVSNLQILTLPSEVPDISTLLLPATTLEPEVTLEVSFM